MYVKETGESNQLYFTVKDHLNSTWALVDESGSITEHYAFNPWRKRMNPINWDTEDARTDLILDLGFTCHEHLDELGLINMKARMYDPILGQFISPDPYVLDEGLSINYNRYAYCLNNPLMFTDPTGLYCEFHGGNCDGSCQKPQKGESYYNYDDGVWYVYEGEDDWGGVKGSYQSPGFAMEEIQERFGDSPGNFGTTLFDEFGNMTGYQNGVGQKPLETYKLPNGPHGHIFAYKYGSRIIYDAYGVGNSFLGSYSVGDNRKLGLRTEKIPMDEGFSFDWEKLPGLVLDVFQSKPYAMDFYVFSVIETSNSKILVGDEQFTVNNLRKISVSNYTFGHNSYAFTVKSNNWAIELTGLKYGPNALSIPSPILIYSRQSGDAVHTYTYTTIPNFDNQAKLGGKIVTAAVIISLAPYISPAAAGNGVSLAPALE